MNSRSRSYLLTGHSEWNLNINHERNHHPMVTYLHLLITDESSRHAAALRSIANWFLQTEIPPKNIPIGKTCVERWKGLKQTEFFSLRNYYRRRKT